MSDNEDRPGAMTDEERFLMGFLADDEIEDYLAELEFRIQDGSTDMLWWSWKRWMDLARKRSEIQQGRKSIQA